MNKHKTQQLFLINSEMRIQKYACATSVNTEQCKLYTIDINFILIENFFVHHFVQLFIVVECWCVLFLHINLIGYFYWIITIFGERIDGNGGGKIKTNYNEAINENGEYLCQFNAFYCHHLDNEHWRWARRMRRERRRKKESKTVSICFWDFFTYKPLECSSRKLTHTHTDKKERKIYKKW